MLTIFQSVLLGALQGITEFLPISSSGHLVAVQQLFGWKSGDGIIFTFDVALHVGTLFAVLVAFRRDVVLMLTGRGWKLIGLLIAATVPAVIVGLTLKDAVEAMFESVRVVGFAWLFTGTFLWCTRYIGSRSTAGVDFSTPAVEWGEPAVSWFKSLIIGVVQAIAIIPGVSRSGSTISAGMFLKLDKKEAARFSFLMAIPGIAGAALLDAKEIAAFPKEGLPQIVIGTLVSFIVGYLSIKWLLTVIQRGRFHWFGVYCWLAGAIALLWSFA